MTAGNPVYLHQPDNTVTLTVNQTVMSGWTSVRVTRGLDRIPSDFDVGMTDRAPFDHYLLQPQPGDTCVLKIGNDPVVTGYVDRTTLSVSSNAHSLRVQGRSKCEDLIDCSMVPETLTGMAVIDSSLLHLATRLCQPFGITVSVGPGVSDALYMNSGDAQQIRAVLTESGWDILERVARSKGVLLYDDTAGNLVIANVGTSSMATGFQIGANVQAAAVSYSMDERFSQYIPCLMNSNFFGQQGVGGVQFPMAVDKSMRYRPKIIVSEQFLPGQSLAEMTAQWEMKRRLGRSQAVRVTADTWRDQKGTLWAPNAYAPIDFPQLRLTPAADPWVIGSVSFLRDAERGTVADVVLMPKTAFQPEPFILLPFLYNPAADPKPGGMVGHV